MPYYRDLREYLKALEERGKLTRVSHPINKDTELHPLVRLQFRGLPEEERKAFYFDNVIDSKGKRYPIPVVVGVLGASPQVYAIGMMCGINEIGERWERAQLNPIKPVLVSGGPVQEEIFSGDTLLSKGGLGEFPIPVSTPGWDIAPYITSPYWVSKDPETGIRNVGTYRGHVKSPVRLGVHAAKFFRGIAFHWRKAKKMGRPLEAAMIVGGPPNVGYASVSQLPTDVDEFGVAGGIAGEPVPLVKCRTVDLEVPANAEIVVEGLIATDFVEPEAPFGEATGYVGQQELSTHFTATCITHRRNPIWQAFISQYPPSESSVIRQIGCANVIPKRLKYDLKMPFILQAAVHFSNGSDRYIVLKMAKTDQAEVWRALEATPVQFPAFSKVIVAVDDDIDPWDANMVNWAITYRCQPHRDIRIVKGHAPDAQDYSVHPPLTGTLETAFLVPPDKMPESSVLMINATMKWAYPPVSLPPKAYMEHAIELWKKLGLPPIRLKEPWFGRNLGFWDDEKEQQAKAATQGEHYKTGDVLAQRRQSV